MVVEGYLEYLYQNGILHSFIVNLSIMLILVLIVDGHAKLMKPIEIIASVVEPEKDFADDDAVFLDMGPVQPEPTTAESDVDVVVDVPSEPNDEAPAPTVLELHIDRETTIDPVVEDRDLVVDLIRPAQARAARGSIAASGDGGNGVGSGVETLRRLEQAGARTGDVQVSIAWDNYNDIDLWVVFEGQQGRFVINWMSRIGPNNGMLDVDRNVQPTTNKAVENIFWQHGFALEGRYTVYVQHYWQWDRADRTPVFLRVLVDGEVVEKKLTVSRIEGVKKVFSFNRRKKQKNEDYSPLASGVGAFPD
jgi:hypothetical protein